MKSYRTLKPFTDGNNYYGDGVIVSLSDKQATFLLAAGNIEPIVPPAAEDEQPVEPKKGAK